MTISLGSYPDLGEKTYQVIKDQVIKGDLPIGEPLLVVDLASQLGISRTPVKDALNRLFAEGLVLRNPRKGYLIPRLDTEDMVELMEARLVVELGAVDKGIRLAEEREVAQMQNLIDQAAGLFDVAGRCLDFGKVSGLDEEFHQALVATSRNRRLMEIHRSLYIHSLVAKIHYTARSSDCRVMQAVQEHRDILAAFEAKDLDATHTAIIRNVHAGMAVYQAALARGVEQSWE